MGVGGEATILQRNYLDWTSRDARSTRLFECVFSFPLDNQKEKRMLLLVARGNDLYARQAERSRPGHAGHAHSENAGAGTYPWIRDFRANRTDEQRCFSPQRGLVISCHSTTREGRANRWRMETH